MLALAVVPALAAAAEPAAEPAVRYVIEARLNPREHTLEGRSRIAWQNRSRREVKDLFLHLYPNAYRDRFSTAAKEQAFWHDETIRRIPPAERGYLDVESLSAGGRAIPFHAFDTLLKARLERPLAPGESIELEVVWAERVRRHLGGAGWEGPRFELVHWYPKLAAHDDDGWHAEPAHDDFGERAEFAAYEVRLDLPRDYVVASTGEPVAGDPGWSVARRRAAGAVRGPEEDAGPPGRKVVRFASPRANDFAWTAAPDLALEEGSAGGRRIQVFYAKGQRSAWSGRALERARAAVEYLERRLGPWPGPALPVVQSPGGEPRGTAGIAWSPEPGAVELATALAALWSGSAVGHDSLREPWIGRGLTAFLAREWSIERFGPAGIDRDDLDAYARLLRPTPARDRVQLRALAAQRIGRGEPVATSLHRFRDRAVALPAVRDKASLLFDDLTARLGRPAFDRALAAWYAENRLRLAGEAELRAAFEREHGAPLAAVFDQWLRGSRLGEVRVERVRTRPRPGGGFDVEVEVARGPEPVPPVQLVLSGEGGQIERRAWDARRQAETLAFHLPFRPRKVEIDPEGAVLELDRLDNVEPLDFDLVFGWPLQEYRPRNAYAVAWRPSLSYNEIDHLRAGMVVEGAHEGRDHRLHLAATLGMSRRRVDFHLRWDTPIAALGRSEIGLEVLKAEGRRLIEGRLRTDLSPRLERRPQTRLEAGFSSFTVSDLEFLRPGRYQPGRVNQVWAAWAGEFAGPYWRSATSLKLQAAGHPLESDFSFSKLSASARISFHRSPTTLRLRTFVGLSTDGDPLPIEERFWLGGADPIAEFREPGLRSRDSLLTHLNWHLPGGGNFRAYSGAVVHARRLLTGNFEIERPLLGRDSAPGFQRLVGSPSLALFADIGKAEGTGIPEISRNALWGLGLGLRLARNLYGRPTTLRLDFPFYVNRPGPDEKGVRDPRVGMRWLFSLEPAF